MRMEEISYKKQEESFSNSKGKRAESWFDKSTADYWRHERGYQILNALNKDTSWITVGDGRFGLDSVRIKEKGFKNVLPTDLCATLLEEGKRRGIIDEYRVFNVETMETEETFDYVFCKEAYHHFFKPINALYNMLKIARKGVVLTEPNDNSSNIVYANYESVGNYVYRLSKQELIKIAISLNYPSVCYWEYNDYYIDGCEYEPADESRSEIFKKIKFTIKEMDQKVKEGTMNYNTISFIIFKEVPSEVEIKKLREMGCTYISLPRNPYLGEFVVKEDKYYIYGTGYTAKIVKKHLLERDIEILGYVDSNSEKWGTYFEDKKVISPEELVIRMGEANVRVIIASMYNQEIYEKITNLGIINEKIIISPFNTRIEIK